MADLLYTKEHEWLLVEGSIATVGISDHAQEQLGEIVFVDLPDIGKTVQQNDDMAVVESVKAASDVYAPISGEVIEVNTDLADDPAKVNGNPEGEGWFVKLKIGNAAELDELMNEKAYQDYLETLG